MSVSMKKIEVVDKYYSADDIDSGRIIKRFVVALSRNVFRQSIKYYNSYNKICSDIVEFPLLFVERNLYSTYAVAINALSPIHVSEWGFSKKDCKVLKKNRRVDFYVKYKPMESSKPVNFYIELKQDGYCLNRNTKEELRVDLIDKISGLLDQLRDIKNVKPGWDEHTDVCVGLMQITGYYDSLENEIYTPANLINSVQSSLDNRRIKNFLVTTLSFRDDFEVQWKLNKCRFISIFSFIP